jgi:8-oxo-dGTP pyrophosphatase MutT (NUDIX family)
MNESSRREGSWQAEPEANQTLESNWLFTLRRERFRSRASGKAHDHYTIELADSVNVVAVTPEAEVLLVRQFRAGSRHDSLETPGGLVDPGEDVREAAARELREETGYAGDPPVLLGWVWANPSILTSRAAFVLIANCRQVAAPELDPSEELTLERIPAGALPGMLREGQIDHALTVAAILWWQAMGPRA